MDAYYLDNLTVMEPRGIDGLTLNKRRNPRWFSMLHGEVGYSNGVGGVVFYEPLAVDYLWGKLLSDGVDAQVSFRVIGDGIVQYEAWVDFTMLKRSYDGISVSFRDELDRITLETGANRPQSLSLTGSVTVPRRTLGGLATFVPTMTTVSRGGFLTAINLLVSLPLKPDDTKTPPPGLLRTVTNPTLTPYEPIYTNTTDRDMLLQVGGFIGGILTMAGGYASLGLTTILPGGGTRTQRIGGVTPTGSGVSLDTAVSTIISIRPGESLAVTLENTTAVSEYSLTLSSRTRLTLAEIVNPAGSMSVRAIRVVDALAQLGGGLGAMLSSSYYGTGEGKDLYLTTGKALRGIDDRLTISLQNLFEGLSATRCLALWGEDGYWFCEPRLTYLKRPQTPLLLNEPIRYTLGPWNEYQYSEIKGGYATWRGSSALSDNETNSARLWVKPGATNRATLDVQSTLIASLTLIEEAIRRREETSGNTDSLDNGVFLIDAGGTGLLSPERAINFWGEVFPLPALSRADEQATGQTLPPASAPLFRGWQAVVDAPLVLAGWAGVFDWVKFYDGEGTYWTGLIIDAQWRDTDEMGEVVTLTLLL